MISGLDLSQTIKYVIEEDTENPTVWELGVIPSYLLARISSENKGDIETAYKILQVTLRGWENFSVPYLTSKETFFGREIEIVPLSLLDQIPLKIVSKLAVKAMEINKLTEKEIKN